MGEDRFASASPPTPQKWRSAEAGRHFLFVKPLDCRPFARMLVSLQETTPWIEI